MGSSPNIPDLGSQGLALRLSPQKPTSATPETPQSDLRTSGGDWKRHLAEDFSDRPAKRFSPPIADPERRRSMYLDPANDRYASPSGSTTPMVVIYTPAGSNNGSGSGTVQPPGSDVSMCSSTELEARENQPSNGTTAGDAGEAMTLNGDAASATTSICKKEPETSGGNIDRSSKKSGQQQISGLREQSMVRDDYSCNSSEDSSCTIKSEPHIRSPINEVSETTLPQKDFDVDHSEMLDVKVEDEGPGKTLHISQRKSTSENDSTTEASITQRQPHRTADHVSITSNPVNPLPGVMTDAAHLPRPRKQPTTETFAEKFKKASQPQKMVWWTRKTIQRLQDKVRKDGPKAFTPSDFANLKQKLLQLSYYDFKKEEAFYRETHISKAVKMLGDRKNFGDDMADMAIELYTRWESGNLGIAPLNSAKFEDVDDDSESASDVDLNDGAAGTGRVGIQRLSLPARQLMDGVQITRSERGRLSQSLDPNYSGKRDAGVFGHNGLTIGQWWPYQICALRDGAHGARQGGIYGREQVGAFSIVTSSDSKYSDRDEGDILYYSGSHDDPAHYGDTAPQLTKNTRLLLKSIHTGKPVRVIRKGPSKKNTYYPRSGYRYDGLYQILDYEIKSGSSGQRDYYRFRLARCNGQVPLTDPSITGRPTRSEYELFLELTGRR